MNAREVARKELERIIGEVLQPWIVGEIKIENLRLPIKGVSSAILNQLPELGFVRLADLSLKQVIDWWIKTYPVDVFVREPKEIVSIRGLMRKIRVKMEKTIADQPPNPNPSREF